MNSLDFILLLTAFILVLNSFKKKSKRKKSAADFSHRKRRISFANSIKIFIPKNKRKKYKKVYRKK
jgi:hypothetical protein